MRPPSHQTIVFFGLTAITLVALIVVWCNARMERFEEAKQNDKAPPPAASDEARVRDVFRMVADRPPTADEIARYKDLPETTLVEHVMKDLEGGRERFEDSPEQGQESIATLVMTLKSVAAALERMGASGQKDSAPSSERA